MSPGPHRRFAQTDQGHESPLRPNGAQVLFLILTMEVNTRLSGPGLRVWTGTQRAHYGARGSVCLHAAPQGKTGQSGDWGPRRQGSAGPSVYLSRLTGVSQGR